MKKIRIGKDLACRLTVITSGEAASLENDSIVLIEVHPDNSKERVGHESVTDNVISFHVSPNMQPSTGVYGFEVWKNIGSGYQSVCDCVRAFELVPLSIMEGGRNDADFGVESVDMETCFTGDFVVVDSLDSYLTGAALSANQGRVLREMIENEEKEREDARVQLEKEIEGVKTDLKTETTTREAEDGKLQDNIDSEEKAREKADDELTEKLNELARRLAFLSGDTVSWVTTDEYLVAFTDSEDNLLLGITKEAKIYLPVGLPDGLVGLKEIIEEIKKETEEADKTLQNNIDALEKATKEAYETKTDAQSAYNKLQEEIDSLEKTGSETYETKSDAEASHNELQASISTKQDKLTAGTGIDITDNVVSCTLDTSLYKIVDELPAEGEGGKIYCIKDPESTDEKNIYDEWYWTGEEWEMMGKYIPTVDLTPYEKVEDAEKAHEELREAIESEATERKATDEALQTGVDNITADVLSFEDAIAAITEELQALSGGSVKWVSDDNYLLAAVDSEDSLLIGVTKEAKLYLPVGLPDGIVGLAELLKSYATTEDIPTNVSELTNDSGYITSSALDGYAKESDIPTVPTKTSELTNDSGYITSSALDGYAKESDIPTVPTKTSELTNDSGYITSSALDGYAKESDIPTVPTKTSELTNDSGYITSSALDGYAKESDIPTVPTKTSELTNDSGYITSSALDGYAKESDIPTVPTKTSELTNDSGFITDGALEDCASKESVEAITNSLNNLTEKVTTLEGDTVKWISNDDYLIALVDSEDSLLMGITKEAKLHIPVGLPDGIVGLDDLLKDYATIQNVYSKLETMGGLTAPTIAIKDGDCNPSFGSDSMLRIGFDPDFQLNDYATTGYYGTYSTSNVGARMYKEDGTLCWDYLGDEGQWLLRPASKTYAVTYPHSVAVSQNYTEVFEALNYGNGVWMSLLGYYRSFNSVSQYDSIVESKNYLHIYMSGDYIFYAEIVDAIGQKN